MQEIADDARGRSPILIAGDFNARSTKWGSASTTQRGTILLEAVASLNVCLLNEGNRPTFSKSGRESTIDLTFASPGLARNCVWRVSDIYTHSDHALIITEHANTCARNIADRVKEACDASMEKAKKGGNGRRPVPWWNEEIGCARRDCLAARRRCQRSRGRGNQKLRETTYRAKRKVLKNAIKASKARCFQELCEAADAEPIGSAYRMVMAPGPDCIPNAALHTLVANYPGIFTEMYNMCLTQRTFPIRWKRQRLVLIPKPGKFNDDRKRSTIDAIQAVTQLAGNAIEGERWLGGSKEYCLVCTLDVKNAFNSANWNLVRQALHRMGISNYLIGLVAYYFKDRVLTYSSDVGEHEYLVTGGVPQGSVLGPILWNVMYDGILRLVLPEGCTVVGFADDIALVTVAKTLEEITDRCSLSIDTLMCWLADNGLAVAEHKTEAVLISSRKTVEKRLNQIDCSHLKDDGEYSRTKAAQQKDHSHSGDIYHIVRRAHMGRSYEDRIIQPPVQSCLQTLRIAHHKQLLHGIRGSRASGSRYYTDRPAGGRTKNWEHRKQDPAQQHDRGMAKERRHGQVDFYLTQMISGHGCFKEYLHRFKHEPNPNCDHCGTGSIEDARAIHLPPIR
ncbi:uncharacterized protein [Drosophila suzukii]|uniref:Reverse transcriptase domain-containing protein n=1 Tax=Drosophila suzukii TaxID=28584 RepID=A0ABM4TNC6_DROSZ